MFCFYFLIPAVRVPFDDPYLEESPVTPQDRDYHVAEKQNGNLFFVVAESKPLNVYCLFPP